MNKKLSVWVPGQLTGSIQVSQYNHEQGRIQRLKMQGRFADTAVDVAMVWSATVIFGMCGGFGWDFVQPWTYKRGCSGGGGKSIT